MSKVVSLQEKRDEGRRKLAEYVQDNCESWDMCVIIAGTDETGINVVTSSNDGVELIGMLEIAKNMLVHGVVDE